MHISYISEPQPDVALLKPREDFYARTHPEPEDVLLIIEVADSSLTYDRRAKMPFYATAGIPEFWLVDLTNQVVEVYARPSAGGYRESAVLGRGETVRARGIAGIALGVDDILGQTQ
ncbi:MAG: Uma2 family endonuclease [Chloroflexia bacterium]